MTDDLWPSVAWLMAGAVCLGVGLGMSLGILSPSLTLDLAALWPLPAIAFVTTLGLWRWRVRRPRLLAIPGLMMLTWIVATLAVHLAADPWLPSASGDVVAPMTARIGRIEVAVESGSVDIDSTPDDEYRIETIRQGGTLSPPLALEQPVDDDGFVIVAIPRDRDAWYQFSGWNVRLAQQTMWSLDVVAPVCHVDLRGLAIDAASIRAARADVELGDQDGPSTLDVTGTARIEVGPNTIVDLVGQASVPDHWEQQNGAATNAGNDEAPDWKIVVHQGSTVNVRQS